MAAARLDHGYGRKLRRFGLEPRDRRIMLISGAAAGMAAVFRAPLTGLVFALEMPYKDDLAHEALLPSLIASVVSYATLVAFVGSEPLFGFAGSTSFRESDLMWSALLGAIIGLIAIVYDITFRRVRRFFVTLHIPHVAKLLIGGLGTALCGLLFVNLYDNSLIPIGPNYEAVREILAQSHPSQMLLVFAVLKLAATICSLGSGGVSAMFVPLLLAGGCIGNAFGQSVVHTNAVDLYAAVGMAAFISGGYKTPLTAVVFVAETTGGHSYLIPSLIGAAVAYAVSGEASVSGDQHLHEMVKIAELSGAKVRDVMQTQRGERAGRHDGGRFPRQHCRPSSSHHLPGLRSRQSRRHHRHRGAAEDRSRAVGRGRRSAIWRAAIPAACRRIATSPKRCGCWCARVAIRCCWSPTIATIWSAS